MAGESKTSKRRLAARDRWLAALELRKAGHTFERIAKELNYSDAASAYNAVMSALKEAFREPVEEMRKLEATRLDKMQEAISYNIGPDKEDGLPVIDRILRIMDRRAKLLGLDMPSEQKIEVTQKGPLVIVRKSKEVEDEDSA